MNLNPIDILKNANKIQEEAQKFQERMKDIVAEGSSGGGIVRVTINGQFNMISITIDPLAVDPRDIPMLQDLIIAAHTNAVELLQEKLKDQGAALANGLNIPGLQL